MALKTARAWIGNNTIKTYPKKVLYENISTYSYSVLLETFKNLS